MNKKLNRTLSILIVALMLAAMLPVGVFALDEAAPAPAAVEEKAEAPAPATEEPAAEEEAEEPAAEEEAEEPAAEEEAEKPAAEEEAEEPAAEEEAEEPAAEEEAEEPAAEEEAEEPAAEEEAEEAAPVKDEPKAEEPKEEQPKEESFQLNAVAAAGAELRKAPNGESELLLTTEEETDILITGSVGDWFHTSIDGKDGYLHRDYIIFEEAEEPVEEEPAEEEPAEEPVEEEPAEEPIEEEPAEEPAEEEPAEEPAEEEPAEEPAEEEPAAEEPVEEELTEIEDYETPLGLEGLTEEEPAEEEEVYEVQYVAAAKADAAVRTDPDGMSSIIMNLAEDAEVSVLWEEGDWFAILLDEETLGYEIGYIYKDDLASEEEEPAVNPEAPKKVTIFTSRRVVMEEGETVTLTSKLEGFDGLELMYVWKVNKGNGFEEVEGANEASYSFEANAETLSWGWLLTVLYR